MLDKVNIENILFLDIETVPMVSSYGELPENYRKLWDRKAEMLLAHDLRVSKETKTSEEIFERAGIYAEFGKIICISTAIIRNQVVWIKSYSGDDEK